MASPDGIVLMAKPDGFARLCTTADVKKIRDCWRDTVSWLCGTDPDDVEHADVVAAVVQKAALRMPRYSAYDITTWMAEARSLPDFDADCPSPAPLIDVASAILADLGFRCVGEYNSWLNRVTIELLYRQSNSFGANRDLLVPALLKGPVAIRYLDGERIALAHALKLVIRAAVAGTSSSLTNLVHMDVVTVRERELIVQSLTPDLARC